MLGFSSLQSASLVISSSWLGCSVQTCSSAYGSSRHYGTNIARRAAVYCGRRGGSGGRDYKRRGDGRRPNRVGELLRREICPIIDDAFARAFQGEDAGSPVIVSVVDVKCSDDLRSARVSVSVLGTDEQRSAALLWLRAAKKELRYELAQAVSLKYIPDLSFAESEMAQAVKTVNILNMLAREREQKQMRSSTQGQDVEEQIEIGAKSVTEEQGLDLDASADDGLILEGLDDGTDDGDDADDALIIEVTEDDEDLEEMGDDKLRTVLFKTLGSDGAVR